MDKKFLIPSIWTSYTPASIQVEKREKDTEKSEWKEIKDNETDG